MTFCAFNIRGTGCVILRLPMGKKDSETLSHKLQLSIRENNINTAKELRALFCLTQHECVGLLAEINEICDEACSTVRV